MPSPAMLTTADTGKLIAAIKACLGRKVAVIYKNQPVDTFMQIEGVLMHSNHIGFNVGTQSADASAASSAAIVRFTAYSVTGFVPEGEPITINKLPVIYIR